MKNLTAEKNNFLRISIYLAGTGIAMAIPASLCCADLLLLRMKFDHHLFGVIKSSMFFLPPLVYWICADALKKLDRNTEICRWSYLLRIIFPLFLPVTALLTDDPSARLWCCVGVFSLGFTSAMFANNTLMSLYRESVPEDRFNRESMFFNALLTVACLAASIPAVFMLNDPQLDDNGFFMRFLILELVSGLFYIPGFIALRNIKKVNQHDFRHTPCSLRDKLAPFADRRYLPLVTLNVLYSIWFGMVSCYWVIYLMTIRNWSAVSITIVEAVLSAAALFTSRIIGKTADQKGYGRLSGCLIGSMLILAALHFAFWQSGILTVAVLILIHNANNGLVSGGARSLLTSAGVTFAPDSTRERYFGVFTLWQSLGCFAGCIAGGKFFEVLCGTQATNQDYRLYFACVNTLLLPLAAAGFFLKRPERATVAIQKGSGSQYCHQH